MMEAFTDGAGGVARMMTNAAGDGAGTSVPGLERQAAKVCWASRAESSLAEWLFRSALIDQTSGAQAKT
jgi:hypothetical protein